MPKRLVAVLGLALAAGAVVAGCNSDRSPLAPPRTDAAVQASSSLLGGVVGVVTGTVGKVLNVVVSLVQRPAPLANDVSWSFTAGPAGASSSSRESGLSIVVPPGALDRTVTITVTARKGNVYDYHFEPEGLQFAKPVVLTQDLSNSSLLGLVSDLLSGKKAIKGAYYAAPTLKYDPATGLATVNELEPSVSGPGTVTFRIRHFSGYTVAACDNDGFGGF
jgi:hypothetical protein